MQIIIPPKTKFPTVINRQNFKCIWYIVGHWPVISPWGKNNIFHTTIHRTGIKIGKVAFQTPSTSMNLFIDIARVERVWPLTPSLDPRGQQLLVGSQPLRWGHTTTQHGYTVQWHKQSCKLLSINKYLAQN